jgi:hypothetical protein
MRESHGTEIRGLVCGILELSYPVSFGVKLGDFPHQSSALSIQSSEGAPVRQFHQPCRHRLTAVNSRCGGSYCIGHPTYEAEIYG